MSDAALLFCPAQGAMAEESKRLDDFSKTYAANENPEGWDDRLDLTRFQFVHEGDQHHIHIMTDSDGSGLLGNDYTFRLDRWPILEWEWRVTKLPAGGDVRDEDANDQAGNMCVAYDPGLIAFDKYVCYLFENKGPIGAEGTASTSDDTKYVILRSGETDQVGEWYSEKRNILEDFTRLWEEEPDEDVAIGMFVDSDDTETSAEVYYRTIILKTP